MGIPLRDMAQDNSPQPEKQLERLREEIRDFEKRLSQSKHQEKDLLGDLEDYNREIALRSELKGKLEQERNRIQRSLQASERELRSLRGDLNQITAESQYAEAEREALAELVKRRAVYMYKYHQRDELKAILTSQSFTQLLTRQEYLRRIAAVDRGHLLRLQQKNLQLAYLGDNLTRREAAESIRVRDYQEAVRYQQKLLSEENAEAALLKKKRAERESLLKRLRNDREALGRQLEEKRQAAARVESLIKTLETQRESKIAAIPRPAPVPQDFPFSQMRGKLNWPTRGKIVSRFGLQRNEKLATVTENPGIDIETEEGAAVASVSSGFVTKITWMRGYGNTVIVDHREGYYSVYAHLDQIQVREGQAIKSGEILGQVSQSGSLSGPRLHFEIWVKREKQDPMKWLTLK